MTLGTKTSTNTHKYLTFSLNNVQYGLKVNNIKEIIGAMATTPMSDYPHFVKGVINLRNSIIPIIDLKVRMGLSESEASSLNSAIIIAEIKSQNNTIIPTGLLVDSVANVININDDQIETVQVPGTKAYNGYIAGVAKTDHNETLLIDINQLLSDVDNQLLSDAMQ